MNAIDAIFEACQPGYIARKREADARAERQRVIDERTDAAIEAAMDRVSDRLDIQADAICEQFADAAGPDQSFEIQAGVDDGGVDVQFSARRVKWGEA